MLPAPRADLRPNTPDYERLPLVTASGFREYDVRWLFGPEINLLGFQALGLGLGTYLHERGVRPDIVTGHDFRSYSGAVKHALTLGLIASGCRVHDIGLALSPTAYFAQAALDIAAVAMVSSPGIRRSADPPRFRWTASSARDWGRGPPWRRTPHSGARGRSRLRRHRCTRASTTRHPTARSASPGRSGA